MPYYYSIILIFITDVGVFICLLACALNSPRGLWTLAFIDRVKVFTLHVAMRLHNLFFFAKYKTAMRYKTRGSPLTKESSGFLMYRKTTVGWGWGLYGHYYAETKRCHPTVWNTAFSPRLFSLHSVPPRRSFFCLASSSAWPRDVHCFLSRTLSRDDCVACRYCNESRRESFLQKLFTSRHPRRCSRISSVCVFYRCNSVGDVFTDLCVFLPVQYEALQLNEL